MGLVEGSMRVGTEGLVPVERFPPTPPPTVVDVAAAAGVSVVVVADVAVAVAAVVAAELVVFVEALERVGVEVSFSSS